MKKADSISQEKTPKPSENKVILHLHIAALLLGGTALFSKLIPYHAIDIISYRSLICGIVLLSIALTFKLKLTANSLFHLCLLVICSLLFTVHWAAYFQAMKVSTVAIGMISMFTFPVITVFLEPLIKKNQLHARDIIMGALVLLGVVMLVPDFSFSNDITLGVAFGVLSGFAVALRNILVSKYLTRYSAFTIMIYHSLITAAVLLPFSAVGFGQINLENGLLLILLGTVFTAIPHTQKTYALKYSSAKSVSMIISLQVVYGSVFAFFLLQEAPTLNTFVGGGIILFTAVYESMAPKKSL